MSIRDIIIVGGGFTGAALAHALADGTRHIRVLEARTTPTGRFAGELLHPVGVDLLERRGLLPAVRDAGAVEVRGFAVHPAPGMPATLLPYAAVPGGTAFGLAFDHQRVVEALRGAASVAPGVIVERGRRVTDVLCDGDRVVGVRVDGEELRADLVLSAEGRHSRLRNTLGFSTASELVSFTAALRVRGAVLPHAGFGHIFLGAPGPILAYPIGPDEVRVCFDVPLGITTDELVPRLQASYTHVLPLELRGAVEATLPTGVELVANHRMRTPRCVRDGFALVGDAGGCAHPLTAAGMTVCLHDVQLLADELDGAADLRRYERMRQPLVRSRALLTPSLYSVFRDRSLPARLLRRGIFRYWRSPRARAASIGLLSGADPTLRGFGRELARVALAALSPS